MFEVGQPEPDQGGVHDLHDAVEGELAVDSDAGLPTDLLELPRMEAAVGGKPQIDAGVLRRVIGPTRSKASAAPSRAIRLG